MRNIGKILEATIQHRKSVGDVEEQKECLHYLEVLKNNPFKKVKTPRAHGSKTAKR